MPAPIELLAALRIRDQHGGELDAHLVLEAVRAVMPNATIAEAALEVIRRHEVGQGENRTRRRR